MEIREEVLNYMRMLGNRLKSDLDEGELAYAKIMEDPILADKVREIDINGPSALKYYQEIESYYDKYVNPNTRIKNLDFDGVNLERISDINKDIIKLFGGAMVGFDNKNSNHDETS